MRPDARIGPVRARSCTIPADAPEAAASCEAHHVDLSGHCAPALHLRAACTAPRFKHLEWFHDHARTERVLFDGASAPRHGEIRPDLTRPGLGLVFKQQDAGQYST